MSTRENLQGERLTWTLAPALAPRLAKELVHQVAPPHLPEGRRRLAAELSEVLVHRVRDVVLGSVWLAVDLGESWVQVETADADAMIPRPRTDDEPRPPAQRRPLAPQTAVGLPPRVSHLATSGGVDVLGADSRLWWFRVEG